MASRVTVLQLPTRPPQAATLPPSPLLLLREVEQDPPQKGSWGRSCVAILERSPPKTNLFDHQNKRRQSAHLSAGRVCRNKQSASRIESGIVYRSIAG
jgi:hypothetical protein